MMLCNKCLDHHEPGPCPPIWKVCALIQCEKCDNEFALPFDATFALDSMQCGQCGKTGWFGIVEWTDEAKKRHGEGYNGQQL